VVAAVFAGAGIAAALPDFGRAAEFTGPNDECLVEQAAIGKIV
jgi:hypothetical protein